MLIDAMLKRPEIKWNCSILTPNWNGKFVMLVVTCLRPVVKVVSACVIQLVTPGRAAAASPAGSVANSAAADWRRPFTALSTVLTTSVMTSGAILETPVLSKAAIKLFSA